MESNLPLVIVFSLASGVLSLIGGILLLVKKSFGKAFARYATPFAAGALLAAAFADLLPSAAEHGDIERGLMATLVGILLFFLMERAIHWFHHHNDDHEAREDRDARVPLIVIGNLLHHMIDGVAIAAGFLVSLPAGIVVTIVVMAHEIPHTIGNFSLLLYKKVPRKQVLLINVAIVLLTATCAAIAFGLGTHVGLPLDILLGLTAGFFIYIAVSDIIPDIHVHETKHFVGLRSVLLLIGAISISILIELLRHFE